MLPPFGMQPSSWMTTGFEFGANESIAGPQQLLEGRRRYEFFVLHVDVVIGRPACGREGKRHRFGTSSSRTSCRDCPTSGSCSYSSGASSSARRLDSGTSTDRRECCRTDSQLEAFLDWETEDFV